MGIGREPTFDSSWGLIDYLQVMRNMVPKCGWDIRGRVHLFMDHGVRPRKISPKQASQKSFPFQPSHPSQPQPIPNPAQLVDEVPPYCTLDQRLKSQMGTPKTQNKKKRTNVCAKGLFKILKYNH
ncbi:hypothetical protein BVC80_8845g7 [Macleaya cordata]|uniref:Uncharacterized protein n=1 Tax=Macleaya cordata TaxID=56857 RepID=A0A200PZW3_MACCD|nr:hypothetical protein BVC80_8845g7 [Macleaya cordata]